MNARAFFDEGVAAVRAGDVDGAAAAFAKAVAADPADAEARYELANAYRDLHRLDEAEREIRTVVAARPQDPKAHTVLGIILLERGRPAEAVAAHEAAMRADPASLAAATNWLNAQQYVPGVTAASLAASHARWAALHAPPSASQVFANAPTMDRPIVVGFVSPDLGRHPVGLLSVRLFENLDHNLIRPVVFSTRPETFEDDISQRIACAAQWMSVLSLSDAALANVIKTAKVDVLIDMSGHTGRNRLKVFAARAAPVQASWLGYPSTTGVPAMDYILATNTLAPRGEGRIGHEGIVRLFHTHACFEPEQAPDVGPLPSVRNGYVTFGCLNNPAKISDDALETFAVILTRVPGSRMKFRYQSLGVVSNQARLRKALESRGIAPERIDISGPAPREAFLSTYNDIDIALDSFPYSGCMTTCEALWMGCPVVTFPGATMAARQSASILMAADLVPLIASDRQGYEDLAVGWAQKTGESLPALRAELRQRLAQSPLCDGALFARDFTDAVRSIWGTWCEGQTATR